MSSQDLPSSTKQPLPFSWPIPPKTPISKSIPAMEQDLTDAMDTSGGESQLVNMFSLEAMDVGVSVCGGIIGTSDQMCVSKNCKFMKHQTVKATIPPERCLYILSMGKESVPTMVYLKPCLSSIQVSSERYERLRTQGRTEEHWELIFNAIQSGKLEDGLAAESLDISEGIAGNTPRKKRMKFSFTPSAYAAGISTAMVPPVDDLGPDEVALSTLMSQWPTLVSYLSAVKELCDSVHVALEEALSNIQKEFNDVDLATFHLKHQIGDRPKVSDLKSIFDLITETKSCHAVLSQRLETVSSEVAGNKLKIATMPKDFIMHMQPVFTFFSQ
mmetsp:Transcript_3766/g.5134  ORF Transcript_3766/g.5134 Transcript_3766/m.5134 type:complete len:329 (+) Transcript_3766:532-1518(+)